MCIPTFLFNISWRSKCQSYTSLPLLGLALDFKFLPHNERHLAELLLGNRVKPTSCLVLHSEGVKNSFASCFLETFRGVCVSLQINSLKHFGFVHNSLVSTWILSHISVDMVWSLKMNYYYSNIYHLHCLICWSHIVLQSFISWKRVSIC